MKTSDIKNPIALFKIIAENNSNAIAVNATGDAHASQEEGFPPMTMVAQEDGGEPPYGKDFNGLLRLVSSHIYNIQNGFPVTFNPEVAQAIGGYPKGAILWYTDTNGLVKLLQSLVDNNLNNFNTNPEYVDDGVNWISVIPSEAKLLKDYVTIGTSQIITGAKTFSTSNNAIWLREQGTWSEAPEATDYNNIIFQDLGFQTTATIQTISDTSNNKILRFAIKNKSYQWIGVPLDVCYQSDGSQFVRFPTPPNAEENSTMGATTAWVNSRITTLMNSAIPGITYPNFTSVTNISTGFVAPTNGFVVAVPNSGYFTLEIYVDGVGFGIAVGHSGSSHGQPRSSVYAPVGKGQTVTFSSTNINYARFVSYS